MVSTSHSRSRGPSPPHTGTRKKNTTADSRSLRRNAGAIALGLEGVVSKDSKSPYVEGPTLTWHWQKIKSKNYLRQEKIEFHPRKFTR